MLAQVIQGQSEMRKEIFDLRQKVTQVCLCGVVRLDICWPCHLVSLFFPDRCHV